MASTPGALKWDQIGERFYETGVDHAVLYLANNDGSYTDGVVWNGITTISENASGATPNPVYADNIKYLNLVAAEEFGCTIDAHTYPEEFAACDGTESPSVGVFIGQQTRKNFGLAYRTRIGNDVAAADYGYKLHLVYGALAAPSTKAYASINATPDAIAFSWAVTTTPVEVPGFKPSATMVIDSSKVSATSLSDLEKILYGTDANGTTAATAARLPLPAEVIALFAPSGS